MNIEIDSLGASLRLFEELRDELVTAGLKFDAEALSHLPYDKLAQCATGIAGTARCSLTLVREEKRSRRERFYTMNEEEFREARTLLQVEQMGADCLRDRARGSAPKWEELRPRQRAWFKLNCIVNHLDGVTTRLQEAIALLQLVQDTHDLPSDFTAYQRRKLEVLLQIYPMSLSDHQFRTRVAEIAFEIKKIIPDVEQKVCEAEMLFGYSCTSDCYRPLV